MTDRCTMCGDEIHNPDDMFIELNEFGYPIVVCADCLFEQDQEEDLDELSFFIQALKGA